MNNSTLNSAIVSLLNSMCSALTSEIKASVNNKLNSYSVYDGQLLHADHEGYLYNFNCDIKIPLRVESPVTLITNIGDTSTGFIVEQTDFSITLHFRSPLGNIVDKAELTTDPSFIMVELIKILTFYQKELPKDLKIITNIFGLSDSTTILQQIDSKDISPDDREINEDQLLSIKNCLKSYVHFVWGPPGTGKTFTLARVVKELINGGEKVLVLSHSNIAVDVASLNVAKIYKGTQDIINGRLIRYGPIYSEDLNHFKELSIEYQIEQKKPALLAKKYALEDERRKLTQKLKLNTSGESNALTRRIKEIRVELKLIEETIKALTIMILNEAKFISTTLSRLAIDEKLRNLSFDTVIIDEASMANLPFVALCALRATKRLLIFGDFRQLPPICLSQSTDAQMWLATDVFETSGVSKAVNSECSDNRITLLRYQYRMSNDISETVSKFAYNDQLKIGRIENQWNYVLPNLFKKRLSILNTSDLLPICSLEAKEGSYSRVNPIHAVISTQLINLSINGCNSIAYISPYRAQAKLVRGLLKETGLEHVTAATVHKFQGNERDVVIIDLTDSFPLKGASNLTGRNVELTSRLLNVALSRAKEQIIIIANKEFMKESYAEYSPLINLFSILNEFSETHNVQSLDYLNNYSDNSFKKFTVNNIDEEFFGALKILGRSLDINLYQENNLSDSFLIKLKESIPNWEDATLFTDFEVGKHFEELDCDIRLMPKPLGFFALLEKNKVFISGTDLKVGLAILEGERITDLWQTLIVGDDLRGLSPNSQIEQKIKEVCGRCSVCGEDRRLFMSNGGKPSIACCIDEKHSMVVLDDYKITDLFDKLDIKCRICGSKASVKSTNNEIYINCQKASGKCTGDFPNINSIFIKR